MEKQTQQKSLAYPEIASFCGEMSMILKSGISALEGLELLMEDTQNELEKELINSMYQSMLEGHTFADALEQTHVFPAYLIHMTDWRGNRSLRRRHRFSGCPLHP